MYLRRSTSRRLRAALIAVSCLASSGTILLPTAASAATGPLDSLGYIDVTTRGADPTGVADATAAIQASLDEAFTKGMAVFVPAGTFLVSDTLQMRVAQASFSSTLRKGYQVIGATASGQRPTIKLKASAANFSSVTSIKPVFQAWLCRDAGCTGNDSNQNYNQVIRNLVIDLGTGNAGAVGIDLQGAEGTAIGNVKVIANGAYAGIHNLPGSGGSVQDLEVVGGRYGVYAPSSQPSPVIAGLKLTNQTTSAIHYQRFSPLTVVGFDITKAAGPVVTGLNLTSTGLGAQEGSANINLIDGTINLTGGTTNRVVDHSDRNVYVRNVWMKNATFVGYDTSTNTGDVVANVPGQWTLVKEYSRTKSYANPVRLVNGVLVRANVALSEASTTATPPSDFVARHTPTAAVPSFQDAGVINVKAAPYYAKGDGVTDDTAALRAAIAAGSKVFLPAGTYRISGTLTLGSTTRLFGVTHWQSRLAPMAHWSPAALTPMVTTVDDPNATTVLADIKIMLPTTDRHLNGLTWRAGRNSVVRYPWIIPEVYNVAGSANQPMQRTIITGNGGGRWFDRWGEVAWDTDNVASRSLLVDGTSQPLTFYMLHGQYQRSDANNEFRNSSNITVYGFKSENLSSPTTSPLMIKSSRNVAVFGYSSNSDMEDGRGIIEILDSTDLLLTNLTRFNNSTDALIGGGTWYHVRETSAGTTVGITAQTVAGLFRRGDYGGASPDLTSPVVSMTAPVAGSTVAGTVVLTANASDNEQVTAVDFYDGETKIGSDVSSPYSMNWSTPGLADGVHTLTAKAYDVAGNTSTSTPILVTVRNAGLALNGVVNGQWVRGDIAVQAVPVNAGGVTNVQFLVNGALVGADAASPYWLGGDNGTTSLGYGTQQHPDGTTVVVAVMSYDGGILRDTRTINVDNTKPSQPRLSIDGVSTNQVNLTWPASTDQGSGVAKYRVYRSSARSAAVQIGVSSTTSYVDASVLSGTSYSYYITAVDAVGNASAASATATATPPKKK